MKELVVAGSTGLLFACAAIREQRHDPQTWNAQLRLLADQGFTAVDFSELWLPMADLSAGDVERLADGVAAAGLDVAGVSIVDVPLACPDKQAEAIAKVRRAIRVTSRLGAPFLSLGFHALPAPGQWPPQWQASDDNEFARAGRNLAPLAAEARGEGIELTMEMFERGVLDRSANLLAIIAACGAERVGANPDLANLLRPPWPLVEEWDQTFAALAPHVNYWHVKNGMRIALPEGGAAYQPTDMQSGTIDYRSAVHEAVRAGFRGPLAIEHYGGDAITHAARGRAYLTKIIEEVCAYEGVEIKEFKTK